MALKLRKAGIRHVRPLLGGFGEWKRRGYPLEEIQDAVRWRESLTKIDAGIRA